MDLGVARLSGHLGVPRPDLRYLADLLAREDHLAPIAAQVGTDGPAAGTRTLLLQPAGGLHTRLLLDRGLDVGRCHFAGYPVDWTSAVGEQLPGHADSGSGWQRGWGGGLLTTCGLRNVGTPSEGHGHHGTFSDQHAEDVRSGREIDSSGHIRLWAEATVRDGDALSKGLVLRRTVGLRVGAGVLELKDIVTNESNTTEQSPILYHVNFGYPFLTSDSILSTNALEASYRRGAQPSAPFVEAMGKPVDDNELFEHLIHGHETPVCVTLTSPNLGLVARVEWDAAELGRAFTWRRRTPGSFVQSIEAANCGLDGRVADRAERRAPFLEPGQERRTSLTITISLDS